MGLLFKRVNGSPMEFHLENLPEEFFEKYSNLIRSNGGKVQTEPDKQVLTFTLPSRSYIYLFVFDVKFIEDCVQSKKILNVAKYFIGDTRLTPKCQMSIAPLGTDTCGCCFFTREDLEGATVRRLENLSIEGAQGSVLKSNSPPQQTEELTSKENDLVSKDQQIPVIVATEVIEPNSIISESRPFSRNSETSSSNAGTTVLLSDSSDSENEYKPRSRSESVNSRLSPESSIAATELNESKTSISKSRRSSTNSERSGANDETPASDITDFEIPNSPGLSSKISAVKLESEPMSPPLSRSESVNLKSLPEAFVLLRRLDELQSRYAEVFVKSEPLNVEGSSTSEFEPSDTENESDDSFSDSKPSTTKRVHKRGLGKRLPPESYQPTEELIKWAKEITKKRKKDQYGYPEADTKYYQRWEQQTMVDFLIKTNKINVSGGPYTWQLASNLKIFPKCRSYSSLKTEFRSNVLSNIESYNLSPEIEAEFLKTRPKIEEASKELKEWAKKVTKNKKKDKFGYPVGGNQISEWEQEMILAFLLESKKIDRAKYLETWDFAHSLKIFPQHRPKKVLQQCFIRRMLPRIETFDLPQNIIDQFLKLRKPSAEGLIEPSAELKAWAEELMESKKADVFEYKKKRHRGLESSEQDTMVQYLIRLNVIEKARMKSTWELGFKLKLFSAPRTPFSLMKTFRDQILPKIENFKLPPEIEAKFLKLRQETKNSTTVEIPEEVKAWAVQVVKNRKKDAFGFPVELRKKIQSWEKRLMVQFVVKMGRIDLAKAPNFWNHAYELKIVPRQRTRFSLANTFMYHILPNIESYNLSPEIKAKFIKSRTVADMKRVPRQTPKGLDISISK
ncbi:uncharacterized protein LOC117173412 [Belonocnema kinseyi]|uniref:uncharacterized protein LOC117173412 n=1 Tax=Belonocnema kinseyi TaxID=2817044 RepID=UPI00143D0A21|nr:uncharacterized protein LOC117173412 [Belonocnema kinseyi]